MEVSQLVHLFFNNPTFSDLTMEINDDPIYLHKIILSQSSKFETAFKTDTEPTQAFHHNTIKLSNYDFEDEMKAFLKSFYTGAIDLDVLNVQFMLMLSVDYVIPWVEQMCSDRLSEGLGVRNVEDKLEFACRVGSKCFERACVSRIDVSLPTLTHHLHLARNVSSSLLTAACISVLSRYRSLWKLYKEQIWLDSEHEFVLEVITKELSVFAVPAQFLAIISWIEHNMTERVKCGVKLFSILHCKYLPFNFITQFVSPCVYTLSQSPLKYLHPPELQISSFIYFIKTDCQEERAMEKCVGTKTVFYKDGIMELEYKEYILPIPLKHFVNTYSTDATCICKNVSECACHNSITCFHVLGAGFMATINPLLDTPILIDSGTAPCYWYISCYNEFPWTQRAGVTYGESMLTISKADIQRIGNNADKIELAFFL